MAGSVVRSPPGFNVSRPHASCSHLKLSYYARWCGGFSGNRELKRQRLYTERLLTPSWRDIAGGGGSVSAAAHIGRFAAGCRSRRFCRALFAGRWPAAVRSANLLEYPTTPARL